MTGIMNKSGARRRMWAGIPAAETQPPDGGRDGPQEPQERRRVFPSGPFLIPPPQERIFQWGPFLGLCPSRKEGMDFSPRQI